MATITMKGNPLHTVGNLPKVGSKAPEFTLVKQDLSEATLGHYKNKIKVLNIVPSLNTSVCGISAKKFNEKLAKFNNVVLIDVSMDLPFAQANFCKQENLTKTETLSAFRSTFADDYGVKIIDGALKGLCSRAVVVIDANDQVIYTEQVADISHEPNYDKVVSLF